MTTLSATELDELIEQTEEQCKNQRCIDSHSVKILLETLRQKIDAEQSLLRAIANSADMYEALEAAILEYGKPGGPWNVPSSPGTWIDKAKAAIVKARGEQ